MSGQAAALWGTDTRECGSVTPGQGSPATSSTASSTRSLPARWEASTPGSAWPWCTPSWNAGAGMPTWPRAQGPGRRSRCSSRPPRSMVRKSDHAEEELVERLDHIDELVQVNGLLHIGIGVQIVTAKDVSLRAGRRQDHDRDATQVGIRFNLCQHLSTVLLGQVQVEQHQVGPGSIGIRRLAVQVGHRRYPVRHIANYDGVLVFPQRFLGEQDVSLVILYQQDLDGDLRPLMDHGDVSSLGIVQ